MRVGIVGASGKLGQYVVQQSLDRGHEVIGVGREVIERAVAGCDGVLVVMTPRGVHGYSTGTTQAVLDHAPPGARLVFSCGWHITRDGKDVLPFKITAILKVLGP